VTKSNIFANFFSTREVGLVFDREKNKFKMGLSAMTRGYN